ncbi:hypothetical protein NMY22_g5756 [Coprinellus aureogranulatus]|nr:hypothetical protein NMY22_g5756 [Coprinellus aureogranulatus]
MTEPPPTEILEYVVDFVASDSDDANGRMSTLLSLATCCKALVPRHGSGVPQRGFKSLSRRTTSFAATVLANPLLGHLVERLVIRFTGVVQKSQDLSSDITLALKHLIYVSDLNLSLADVPPGARIWNFPKMIPAPGWRTALLSLLQLPQLRRLSLRHLQRFPAEILLHANSVQVLDMFDTGLTLAPSKLPAFVATEALQPITLAGIAGQELRGRCLISRLERLHILAVADTTWWDVNLQIDNADVNRPSLLTPLGPAFFMALTEISIRVATDLGCPDIMLTEPYVYEWNSVIAQCHQLERFQFVHIFQGCLEVHPSSFGSQWASAFNIFSDRTICTSLKAVLFLVEARALQEDAITTEKNIRDREAFISNLQASITSNHSLSKLQNRKDILARFSFEKSLDCSTGSSGESEVSIITKLFAKKYYKPRSASVFLAHPRNSAFSNVKKQRGSCGSAEKRDFRSQHIIAGPILALFTLLVNGANSTPSTPQKCDPQASGRGLEARQKAAIRDFGHIFLVEKNPKKAFDAYIPGTYIQHNPDALSGREPAIDVGWRGNRDVALPNEAPEAGIHRAIMDRLRFEGTCFVEHWDVIQPIFGNETNPLAFF